MILPDDARSTHLFVNINPVSHFEQLREGIISYSNDGDSIRPGKQQVALFRKNSIAHIPPKAKTDRPRYKNSADRTIPSKSKRTCNDRYDKNPR